MLKRKRQFLLLLYSTLLRLYPAGFRGQFGQEMLDAFCDLLDERGPSAAWSLILVDFLPTLLREHLEDCSSIVSAIRLLLCVFPSLVLYTLVLAHIQNLDEFGLITFWLLCILASFWQTGCRGRTCLVRAAIASVAGLLFPLWLISLYQPMSPGFWNLVAPLTMLALTVGLILGALARLAMEGVRLGSVQKAAV